MAQAPRDENRITALLGTSTSTSLTLPIGAIPISGVNPLTVAVVDATGTQITSFGGSILNNDAVDAGNSSTTPLAGNASFTGTSKDTLGYSSVSVYVYSDQNSAANGVKIEFSSDGTNWNDATVDTFTAGNAAPNDGQTYLATCRARYARVVYTNGATLQTTFRLNTVLRVGPMIGDIIPVADVPTSVADHAQLVKAAIMGKTTAGGGAWVDVKVNPSGALTAAVTAADGDVFVRSNAAATFPVNATQVTSPWIVAGGGTAGTAASGVLTVQGIASMTPVQVSQATASNLNATVVGTGTFAVQATEATLDAAIVSQGTALGTIKNLMTAGSVTTNAPTYTTGQINPLSLTTAGGLRVDLKDTVSNTNNLNVNLAASAATVTVSATNLSTNVAQMNGVTVTMGNGVAGTGVQRVAIASDNTAFSVNAVESGTWTVQPGNTANTTPWLVKQSPTLGVTPVRVAIAASTSGDNTLIAAQGVGKVVYVYAFELSFSGTVNAKFTDGAGGTNLGGLYYGVVNAGAADSTALPGYLWAGTSNTALILNLSGATAVGGGVSYFVI